MKLKNFLLVAFLMAFSVLFVACNDKEPDVITITLESDFTTVVGENGKLTPQLVGTEEELVLVFSSEDPTIVEIDQSGNFKPLKAGTTKLTVEVEDNEEVTASVNVKVIAKVEFKDFAPTSVKLTGADKVAVNGSTKLTAEVAPATANDGLFWSSSNTVVATVLNDGTVLGHAYGTTTITATSVIDPTVKATKVVNVGEEATNAEVLEAAIAYLGAQLPEYVHEDFELPTHPNTDIEVTWVNALSEEIEAYEFTSTTNKLEDLVLVVKHKEEQKSHTFKLKLTPDLENNLHEKLPKVVYYVKQYMASVGTNVTGDLLLKTEIDGVPVAWTSNTTNVISNAGKFTRPNNDTPVKLNAIVGIMGLQQFLSFDVTAVGYTQAEKVEYMLTQGDLAPLVDLTSSANLSFPPVDEKFGASFTWVSGSPEVISNEGRYVDLEFTEPTTVTFTVTIKYEVTGFAFEQDVDIDITFLPLDEVGKAVMAFEDANIEIPTHVAFGAHPQIPNQFVDLPTTVDGHDGVTISWYGKEGEFDTEMKALLQRILYTPTEIYAKFSKPGSKDAVKAFPVNIGIQASPEDFAFTARTTLYTGLNHNPKDGMPAAEGGVGTPYALGYIPFYFKSNFTITVGEDEITKDWYFFFAGGNLKEFTDDHLVAADGKFYVDKNVDDAKVWYINDKDENVYSPVWGSTARFWKNTTDQTIYVKLNELAVDFGAQAASDAYTVFAIDGNGIVTTANVSITGAPEGVTEVAIPAGGMLVNPAYLDGANLRPFGFEGNKIDILPLTDWK